MVEEGRVFGVLLATVVEIFVNAGQESGIAGEGFGRAEIIELGVSNTKGGKLGGQMGDVFFVLLEAKNVCSTTNNQ